MCALQMFCAAVATVSRAAAGAVAAAADGAHHDGHDLDGGYMLLLEAYMVHDSLQLNA